MSRYFHILAMGAVMAALASCCCINEDFSKCPPKEEAVAFHVDYELHLVTNITTEIETELSTDPQMQAALHAHLQNIFTDYAHDVDLAFYDAEPDPLGIVSEALSLEEQHDMEGNHANFPLNLAPQHYRHLAAANLKGNSVVSLEETRQQRTSVLRQKKGSPLPSHETGLFSARLDMEVKADEDQAFDVRLYMVNCAAALVIDTTGVEVKDVKVYTTGFASDYSMDADEYVFAPEQPLVLADAVKTEGESRSVCYCSVNMPTENLPSSRLVLETEEPFQAEDADAAIWQYRVYVTLPDGKVTETRLGLNQPLRPGQLKIVKARLDDEGVIRPEDARVGVSVTLDWQQGGEHEIEL